MSRSKQQKLERSIRRWENALVATLGFGFLLVLAGVAWIAVELLR